MNVDLAHHEIFCAKVGKDGLKMFLFTFPVFDVIMIRFES